MNDRTYKIRAVCYTIKLCKFSTYVFLTKRGNTYGTIFIWWRYTSVLLKSMLSNIVVFLISAFVTGFIYPKVPDRVDNIFLVWGALTLIDIMVTTLYTIWA